jgi:predicted homoserine dehydrogenase-like protein
VAKDEVLTYEDVVVPEGRLADRLRAEQNEKFAAAPV